MKANITNNKKNTTMRKIVPAAGMLSISAVMLATSTYAWFTMSREVEVQNIQMTATVPEDLQLSLGAIGSSKKGTSLAENTGFLSGTIAADPVTSFDWSNTADISHYYSFGRLIPASSDTGANIFFTPDANGNGQTVKTDAKFYTAANAATAVSESDIGNGTGTLNATSHIKTDGDTWTGTRSTAWNVTNDDGYYIDIPVWLRTSSTSGASVSVKAYVVDKNAITDFGTDTDPTVDGKELYKAVRVAILTNQGAAAAATGGNLLPVADGNGTLTNSDPYTGGTVLDWYTAKQTAAGVTNPSKVWGGAINTVATQGTTTPKYTASPTAYTPGTSVATLAAGEGNKYGTATKIIVRVWLEGEDPDCYNETSGQDWSINLKFENETTKTTPTPGSGTGT